MSRFAAKLLADNRLNKGPKKGDAVIGGQCNRFEFLYELTQHWVCASQVFWNLYAQREKAECNFIMAISLI